MYIGTYLYSFILMSNCSQTDFTMEFISLKMYMLVVVYTMLRRMTSIFNSVSFSPHKLLLQYRNRREAVR